MDLALYNLAGTYEDTDISGTNNASEATIYASADSPTTTTQAENIAGKVLKFLYTYKGSDPFRPDYGGTALHWKNISPASLAEFRAELDDDITRCCDFIKTAENTLDASTDRLYTIIVRAIDYPVSNNPTYLNIHLVIVTTSGAYATLRMTTV